MKVKKKKKKRIFCLQGQREFLRLNHLQFRQNVRKRKIASILHALHRRGLDLTYSTKNYRANFSAHCVDKAIFGFFFNTIPHTEIRARAYRMEKDNDTCIFLLLLLLLLSTSQSDRQTASRLRDVPPLLSLSRSACLLFPLLEFSFPHIFFCVDSKCQ